jgi:hypothetical protein
MMAVIYLRHSIHGSKVACSDWEADYDEQHGWERYDVDAPAELVSPEANTLRVKRKYRKANQVDATEGN